MVSNSVQVFSFIAAFVFGAVFLAWSNFGSASEAPDDIGSVFWHPDETHCRFVKSGLPEPEEGKPDSWRYLFVTELISDDISSVERGYMRLGGLLRELVFLKRRETEAGEVRSYKTLGLPAHSVEVNMRAGETKKSRLGQRVFFEYTGTVNVDSGLSQRLLPFTGSCGIEPEKLK